MAGLKVEIVFLRGVIEHRIVNTPAKELKAALCSSLLIVPVPVLAVGLPPR